MCGSEGYTEFLNEMWSRKIMQWQTIEGCYQMQSENRSNNSVKERSANIIAFGCTDHTTGLGVAALALNLRYVKQTH